MVFLARKNSLITNLTSDLVESRRCRLPMRAHIYGHSSTEANTSQTRHLRFTASQTLIGFGGSGVVRSFERTYQEFEALAIDEAAYICALSRRIPFPLGVSGFVRRSCTDETETGWAFSRPFTGTRLRAKSTVLTCLRSMPSLQALFCRHGVRGFGFDRTASLKSWLATVIDPRSDARQPCAIRNSSGIVRWSGMHSVFAQGLTPKKAP
jgi:hypothetical protein